MASVQFSRTSKIKTTIIMNFLCDHSPPISYAYCLFIFALKWVVGQKCSLIIPSLFGFLIFQVLMSSKNLLPKNGNLSESQICCRFGVPVGNPSRSFWPRTRVSVPPRCRRRHFSPCHTSPPPKTDLYNASHPTCSLCLSMLHYVLFMLQVHKTVACMLFYLQKGLAQVSVLISKILSFGHTSNFFRIPLWFAVFFRVF